MNTSPRGTLSLNASQIEQIEWVAQIQDKTPEEVLAEWIQFGFEAAKDFEADEGLTDAPSNRSWPAV